MSERIRILYCTGDFKGGGTQRYLLSLLRGLDRRRFEPSVVCLADRGELSTAMHATGVPIRCFPMHGAMWHPLSLVSVVALARWIRGRFDLVHTLLGHANVAGMLASALAGERRVIASQRNLHPVYGSFRSGNPWMGVLARRLFRHVARRVVVNNAAIAAVLRDQGVSQDRILYIPNGIDVETFRPARDRRTAREAAGIDPEAELVGFVGRMIPDKGLGRVIEAAENIAADFPALAVLAVGEGPERPAAERAGNEGPLRGRVLLRGFEQRPETVYPLLDILAFPSTYSEGTPNVMLEAMSCAVPVVSHRMPQTEAVVRDGETGILLDARSTTALARALAQLLGAPERARVIGEAARRHVIEHYRLEDMLAATARLYEAVASGVP